MTDADRIAAIVCKAEDSCCTVTIDEIRWLADRAARPLTVGAALAGPQAQVGSHVTELRGRAEWHQIVVLGHRFETRSWVDGAWSPLRSCTLDGLDIAVPCRLVPLAEADANPNDRGEMP